MRAMAFGSGALHLLHLVGACGLDKIPRDRPFVPPAKLGYNLLMGTFSMNRGTQGA
jgi:hypothetical protein